MSTVIWATLFFGAIVIFGWLEWEYDKHRLRKLAASRTRDSICTFARSLDYRQLDTKVIRAAYEGLQLGFHGFLPNFPIRSSDRFWQDLRIDLDDLDEVVFTISKRSGRSLDGCESNAYYGKVETVADLILFLCAQPKVGYSSKST